MDDDQDEDRNIVIWRYKMLIKKLEAAKGNGKSLISLIIPPGDQISEVDEMLRNTFRCVSDNKSGVGWRLLLETIRVVHNMVSDYLTVPPNGLVLYAGSFIDDFWYDQFDISFEPFKPINASLFSCDSKFHTEPLVEFLDSDNKFGFIIMDADGTLFGTLCGNNREVLRKLTVDLPKKQISELATHFFINPCASQPNIAGLILAATADDLKTWLSQSDIFDPRLQAKIIHVVDVSCGGEDGFHQAIRLSSETRENVKFKQEKELLGKYFEEISQDIGKYVFGIDGVLKALDMGAVETLIVWEYLDIIRYDLKNCATGDVVIKHLNKEQEADQSSFRDSGTSAELEVQDKCPLCDWLICNYETFGCSLEFVTNQSREGYRFWRVYGGIGGILRHQLDV